MWYFTSHLAIQSALFSDCVNNVHSPLLFVVISLFIFKKKSSHAFETVREQDAVEQRQDDMSPKITVFCFSTCSQKQMSEAERIHGFWNLREICKWIRSLSGCARALLRVRVSVLRRWNFEIFFDFLHETPSKRFSKCSHWFERHENVIICSTPPPLIQINIHTEREEEKKVEQRREGTLNYPFTSEKRDFDQKSPSQKIMKKTSEDRKRFQRIVRTK